MNIYLGPKSEIIPEEFTSQHAGKEAMKLPLLYLIVLQLPFLGVWISLIKGNFEPRFTLFIIIYCILTTLLVRATNRYRKISFGYDSQGIFMNKSNKRVNIPWSALESIELVREFREFNEIDMFPINDIYLKSRFLYRFTGNSVKFTVSQFYRK